MQFSAAGYCIVFLRVQMLTWAPCSHTPWHYSSHRLNHRVSLSCRPKNAKIYEFCVLLDRKFGDRDSRLTSSKNSQNRIFSLLTAFTNISLILRLLLRRIWRSETWYARRFEGNCWLCPKDWASRFLLGSECLHTCKGPGESQILHILVLTLSLLQLDCVFRCLDYWLYLWHELDFYVYFKRT